jgi:membrane protease YdiL (CAAX protease family)
MGLTLQQRDRSARPSIYVAIGLCMFAWGVIWLVGNKGEPTAERLLYQATLPGLDEELFFRGLLLALMLKAFVTQPDHRSAWPAAVVVTFLFAAGHTLMFQKGSFAFDPFFFGYVAILGAGLMWIRLRTGSVLLPVLTHNVINFGNSFIPG